MDHIESQGPVWGSWGFWCEQNSLPPPPSLFLWRWALSPHLEGLKSRWGAWVHFPTPGVPKGPLSLYACLCPLLLPLG